MYLSFEFRVLRGLPAYPLADKRLGRISGLNPLTTKGRSVAHGKVQNSTGHDILLPGYMLAMRSLRRSGRLEHVSARHKESGGRVEPPALGSGWLQLTHSAKIAHCEEQGGTP
jgi:hypothetical protein